ncbi:hypothetical protein SE17_26280 [Kouleothrix aurantiaca]|uniref:threonine ammonia-lyase n=1 Tax=Kouleothrix aurantiaca TaxID=186479 RepID=A0A0P9DKY9_9CHLR|nr:hypothetical protein SE17_26280 [Kouleothrix aurantiaca]
MELHAAIAEAEARIRPYVRETPLDFAPALSALGGAQVFLKLENVQHTHSFKLRGVMNKLLRMHAERRAQGVVAASSGNHGAALAYACAQLGTHALIFVPERAAPAKIAAIRQRGAEVRRHGNDSVVTERFARQYAEEHGLAYVSPYNDWDVVCGQGTVAAELARQLPQLDALLVAVGGGGLIGGLAMGIKETRPSVRVIGVEPEGSAAMRFALEQGRVAPLAEVRTVADTLAPRAVSDLTLRLAQRYVDDVVTISDAQMLAGMRWLWAECNQLVEPAGAAVIAALQSGAVDAGAYRHPVALICGGNAAVESVFTAYGA